MDVKILKESGFEEAMLGISLSYNKKFDINKQYEVAKGLSKKEGGHNKFLESLVIWIDVTAPRYFWQQLDTYRVGTTKQSESTMHTILRKQLTQENFQGPGIFYQTLERLNQLIRTNDFMQLKKELPESFLQRRIICTNYKVLRNMISQRRGHKLQEWKQFINDIKSQVEYPEFLP